MPDFFEALRFGIFLVMFYSFNDLFYFFILDLIGAIFICYLTFLGNVYISNFDCISIKKECVSGNFFICELPYIV